MYKWVNHEIHIIQSYHVIHIYHVCHVISIIHVVKGYGETSIK